MSNFYKEFWRSARAVNRHGLNHQKRNRISVRVQQRVFDDLFFKQNPGFGKWRLKN